MKKMFFPFALGLILASLMAPCGAASSDHRINLQTLFSKKVPILLEFGRGWCIPCKYMKPILDDMAAAYAGRAIILTVDMDVNKDLARDFRIRMMPTQVFLTPEGKEYFRNEGTLEREGIMRVFSEMGALASARGGGPATPLQPPVQQAPAMPPATR